MANGLLVEPMLVRMAPMGELMYLSQEAYRLWRLPDLTPLSEGEALDVLSNEYAHQETHYFSTGIYDSYKWTGPALPTSDLLAAISTTKLLLMQVEFLPHSYLGQLAMNLGASDVIDKLPPAGLASIAKALAQDLMAFLKHRRPALVPSAHDIYVVQIEISGYEDDVDEHLSIVGPLRPTGG